jgi:hypothetical protein
MDGFLQANIAIMKQFGVDSVYNSVTEGTYDTSTGLVNNTSVQYNLKSRISLPKFSETQLPNLVGKKVQTVFILPQTFTPKPNDSIQVGTDIYTINVITTQYGYAGTVVGYKFLCVKS